MCLHKFVKLVTATVCLRQFYAMLTQCDQVLFDNNDGEPKSQVRLLSFQKKIKIFQTRIVKSILSFC